MSDSIQTILLGLTLFVTAFFSWRAYSATVRINKLNFTNQLLEIVDSNKALAERLHLYESYCENPSQFEGIEFLSETEQKHVSEICEPVFGHLSKVGILLSQRIIKKNLIKEWMHTIPVKMWIIMEDYVQFRKKQSIIKHAPILEVFKVGFDYWYSTYTRDKKLKILLKSEDCFISGDELRKRRARLLKALDEHKKGLKSLRKWSGGYLRQRVRE